MPENMLTRLSLPLFAALGLAAGACTATTDDDPDATLTVINDSDFTIDELYVTASVNDGWGRNYIPDLLLPGEDITLAVVCDTYDALIVDETGVECEQLDLDLCLNDATWHITNNTCPVFDAAKQAETK